MVRWIWRTTSIVLALAALLVLLAACCCCSGTTFREPRVVQVTVWATSTPARATATPAPTRVPPTPQPTPEEGAIGSVAVEEMVSGELAGEDVTDVWSLLLDEPTTITIDVVAEDNAWDPVLEVWETGGEEVAGDDDSGEGYNPRLSVDLPAGSYELRVRAYTGTGWGEYALSVMLGEPEVIEGGGVIEYGETATGYISDQMTEEWEFEGQARDYVSISMVGLEGFDDTYLELYSADGGFLTADDDSGDGLFALISGYVLPETGTYRIVASAYGSEMGPYELSLNLMEISERSIAYDQVLEGELSVEISQEHWFFDGVAGDTVTISMVGVGTFSDTYLELYGPDGEWLAMDDDSGEGYAALIGGYELPETGTYRIVASAFGEERGAYELSLLRVKEQTIAYGQTLTGELTTSIRRENWLFEGTGGDLISVSVVGLGDLEDTYLELTDLDGVVLAEDDDSGKDAFSYIGGVVLPYTGTYRIVASAPPDDYYLGEESPAAVGSYRLTLEQIEERAIFYGQTLSGALTEEAPRGYWSFEGSAGDLVSLSMTEAGGFSDTYLELYGPNGELLAEDDDSGSGYAALIDALMLPQTGAYRIVARGYGDAQGTYSLTLRRLFIQERPIAYGETLTGDLTEGALRGYWSFQGEVGDVVTISMVGLEGFEDTYLALYGPDGVLLMEDDDSGEGLFALIEDLELPESGAYRIVARAFGGGLGSYELSLEGGP